MLHLFKVCIMEHRESQAIATRGEGAPELRMAPSHPNIAVLGTGSIGQRHLAVLRDELGMQPVAVPLRESRLAELRAEGYATASTIGQAVAPDDLCIISTDTGRHLQGALAALKSGWHVLIEKPILPTASGLIELEQAAQRCDRRIFVGCVLRFNAGLQRFRDTLPLIGPVHSVRIECQSFLPDWRPGRDYRLSYSARRNEGGVLRDLIHEIDYALWLYGRPNRVFCQLGNTGELGIEAEEYADLFWISSPQVAVSMRLDYLARIPRRRMRAFGAQGELEWDAQSMCVALELVGQPTQKWNCTMERNAMFREQSSAFLRAVQGGDCGALATFDEGAFAIALCDAARESAQSGKSERIKDWRTE
jgi:predicted dehydrogenase